MLKKLLRSKKKSSIKKNKIVSSEQKKQVFNKIITAEGWIRRYKNI